MNSSRESKSAHQLFDYSDEKEQKKIYTGKSILVLGGREDCEFKHFIAGGMKESERNKFYVVDIDTDAKPDLIADFTKPLNLVDEQFDIAMMAGCPTGKKDINVFQNAYRVLKKQGIFLFSIGVGAPNEIYAACHSVFDHVYFASHRLLDSDASSIKLYNGPYKSEYANTTSLGTFIVAFKGPLKNLKDIYHEHPNFKYLVNYIFFKGTRADKLPTKLQFESILSAIEKGMGISVQKDDKFDLHYEIQIALRVLYYNTKFFGGNYIDLEDAVNNELKKNNPADLYNLLGLLVKLSSLLPFNKASMEQNLAGCIELAELQNAPLKNVCLDYINHFLGSINYKASIEKLVAHPVKEFDAVIPKYRK